MPALMSIRLLPIPPRCAARTRVMVGPIFACVAFCWALVPAFAHAAPAKASPGTGIVVLPVLNDGAAKPQADALRRALREEGTADVLTTEEIAERLSAVRKPAATSLEGVRKTLDEAEEAFAAFDAPRSLALLNQVIGTLEADLDVTEEKRALLEEVRLRTVKRLMGTASAQETGRGQTPEGVKARALLVDMLRQNPRLNLNPKKFSPKLRRLLEDARTELSDSGLVGLSVQSTPQQAQVFVEGRVMGLTPLRLPQALAPGRYRIWVEKDEQRSVPRVVVVADKAVDLEFDLAFESTVDAEEVALTPPSASVPEDLAFRVGNLANARQLILVGIANYDGASWLYGASFDPHAKETKLRGAVRLDPIGVTDADTRKLAVFLAKGTPKELNPNRVPLARKPPPATSTAEAEDPSVLPWLLASGGAAAVVVATAATVGTVAAIIAINQPRGLRVVLLADQ